MEWWQVLDRSGRLPTSLVLSATHHTHVQCCYYVITLRFYLILPALFSSASLTHPSHRCPTQSWKNKRTQPAMSGWKLLLPPSLIRSRILRRTLVRSEWEICVDSLTITALTHNIIAIYNQPSNQFICFVEIAFLIFVGFFFTIAGWIVKSAKIYKSNRIILIAYF